MLNGTKIKELREACGWTPTEMLSHLAKEQGMWCSPSSLRSYELGRTKDCSSGLLFAMAKLFDVKPEDLFDQR